MIQNNPNLRSNISGFFVPWACLFDYSRMISSKISYCKAIYLSDLSQTSVLLQNKPYIITANGVFIHLQKIILSC